MNNKSSGKTPILIVARDMYPPFRVDVTILFSKYLKKYLKIDWLMRHDASKPGTKVSDGDETYYIIGRNGIRGKLDAVIQHLKAVYRIFRKDYAIVQCRDTFLLASLYSIASRLSGVPFVYWMSYPMEEGYLLRAGTAFAKRRYAGALVRWIIGTVGRLSLYYIALPIAHHIFVQSDQMKNDLLAEGLRADKITPVPMGVDTDSFSPAQCEPAADAFYAGREAILYLGSLDLARQMNIPAAGVAKALKSRPNAIFVMIGRASQPERDLVAEEFGDLSSRIFFLEQMPLLQALSHVRRAGVCLAPYPASKKMLASATPTKLVEYLAMGRRVVANRHPDQSAVIAGAGLGLLSDFTIDGFSQSILQALDLGEPTALEMTRAREWIRENRDYFTLSEKIAPIYAKTANSNGVKKRWNN